MPKKNVNTAKNHSKNVLSLIFDENPLEIHGISIESDGSSGKSDFDDEYYRNKPDPIQIDKRKLVIITATEENQVRNQKEIATNRSSDVPRKRKWNSRDSGTKYRYKSRIISNTNFPRKADRSLKNAYCESDDNDENVFENLDKTIVFTSRSAQINQGDIADRDSMGFCSNENRDKIKYDPGYDVITKRNSCGIQKVESPQNMDRDIVSANTSKNCETNHWENFFAINKETTVATLKCIPQTTIQNNRMKHVLKQVETPQESRQFEEPNIPPTCKSDKQMYVEKWLNINAKSTIRTHDSSIPEVRTPQDQFEEPKTAIRNLDYYIPVVRTPQDQFEEPKTTLRTLNYSIPEVKTPQDQFEERKTTIRTVDYSILEITPQDQFEKPNIP